MLATASLLLLAVFAQDDKPLEKGPIHEAYAQPFEAKPVLGPLLKKKPPEPLKEVPPDDKPQGKDVRWMDGYWLWDEERDDYIWVSGFWRQVPPGKEWVQGRFEPLEGQWRWIPGYWRDQQIDQEEFVDEPPPVIPEVGPSIPAPNPQMTWASGYWVRQGPRWAWRPGVWIAHRPGWVWHPGRWIFARFGFTFVPGYWDYALEYRGLLYSPVYYTPVVYQRPGFFHRPRYVVCYEDLPCGLFYRRGFGTYYYGDYFRASYVNLGFQFWVGSRSVGPDPLFSYYRNHNRDRWVNDMDFYRRERFAGRAAVAPVINTTVVNVTNVKNVTNINNQSTVNNTNVNNRNGVVVGPGGVANTGPGAGGINNIERKTSQVRVIEASKQPKIALASNHPAPVAKDIPPSQIPPQGQGKSRPKEISNLGATSHPENKNLPDIKNLPGRGPETGPNGKPGTVVGQPKAGIANLPQEMPNKPPVGTNPKPINAPKVDGSKPATKPEGNPGIPPKPIPTNGPIIPKADGSKPITRPEGPPVNPPKQVAPVGGPKPELAPPQQGKPPVQGQPMGQPSGQGAKNNAGAPSNPMGNQKSSGKPSKPAEEKEKNGGGEPKKPH